MFQNQPDNRIHRHELGFLKINGKSFVVNRRRGVPYNAVIEVSNGILRCWASHTPLDEEAAKHVQANAEYAKENNAFIWKQ